MRKFRSDSRVCNRPPVYLTEAEVGTYPNEHDRQEVLKLKVGEYYLNEYTRFTRVE